jgi:8-hydroxy-5-deazaflavin:NADPH oxidoreductase
MKLAIIGTGNVCGALGKLWGARGHQIMFGVSDPENPRVKNWIRDLGSSAVAARVQEASDASDTVVLAASLASVQDLVSGSGNLSGKILLDCTHPAMLGLSGTDSAAREAGSNAVHSWAQGARLVKAHIMLGSQEPLGEEIPAHVGTMFLCGDDAGAKRVIRELGEELDFEVVDIGNLSVAHLMEPLAILWRQTLDTQGLSAELGNKLAQRLVGIS